jgi:NitT/TauT family transport system substrate-binding protein
MRRVRKNAYRFHRSSISAGLLGFAGGFLFLLLTGCGGGDRTVTIADQYGIAYLPIQIVKQEKLLEKRLPDTRIRWEKMGNAAAIREAMIAEKLDVGFMGIPPFLIGYDRGMDWRIFTGLSEAPLGLVTLRQDVRTLDDIEPDDRIALPQPGSIQHILLSMAAERRFGNPERFDSRLVTLSHPDGMQALLAGREITAHFTSPPFLFEELDQEGARLILTGEEAFQGNFSFIVGAARREFLSENRESVEALIGSIEEAISLIREDPAAAADSAAAEYGIPADTLLSYIEYPGMKFATEVVGVERFISFMRQSCYVGSGFSEGEIFRDGSKL